MATINLAAGNETEDSAKPEVPSPSLFVLRRAPEPAWVSSRGRADTTATQVPEDAPFLVVKSARHVVSRQREAKGDRYMQWKEMASALGLESPASEDVVG